MFCPRLWIRMSGGELHSNLGRTRGVRLVSLSHQPPNTTGNVGHLACYCNCWKQQRMVAHSFQVIVALNLFKYGWLNSPISTWRGFARRWWWSLPELDRGRTRDVHVNCTYLSTLVISALCGTNISCPPPPAIKYLIVTTLAEWGDSPVPSQPADPDDCECTH